MICCRHGAWFTPSVENSLPLDGVENTRNRDFRQASAGNNSLVGVRYLRFYIVYRQSPLGSVDPSFRALSGRLKFTVRRHKFNADALSWCQVRGARVGRLECVPDGATLEHGAMGGHERLRWGDRKRQHGVSFLYPLSADSFSVSRDTFSSAKTWSDFFECFQNHVQLESASSKHQRCQAHQARPASSPLRSLSQGKAKLFRTKNGN